jgi:uncharacterized protein (TIGR04255 family)
MNVDMNQRTLPPLKLDRSPLLCAIGQLKISAIIDIEDYLKQIQQRMRHSGFPRFRRGLVQMITFAPDKAEMKTSPRLDFFSADGTECISVAQEAITLVTSNYDVFESFQSKLMHGLEVVNEAVPITFIERIGIRYLDVLRADETSGVTLSSLVKEPLRGVDFSGISSIDAKNPAATQRLECQTPTEHGMLIVRLSTQVGASLPPNIFPMEVTYKTRPKPDEVFSLLDLDHYSQQGWDMNPGVVSSTLWVLHDTLDQVFRTAVVTDDALKYWGMRHV